MFEQYDRPRRPRRKQLRVQRLHKPLVRDDVTGEFSVAPSNIETDPHIRQNIDWEGENYPPWPEPAKEELEGLTESPKQRFIHRFQSEMIH